MQIHAINKFELQIKYLSLGKKNTNLNVKCESITASLPSTVEMIGILKSLECVNVIRLAVCNYKQNYTID